MQRLQAEEGLEVLKPELGTRPRVYYRNLHVMTSASPAEPSSGTSEGVEECAAGVEVVLKQDGREVGRATTDTFGEFKIDRLEPNSSGYRLEATGASERFSIEFDLGDESRYLGVVTLAAA